MGPENTQGVNSSTWPAQYCPSLSDETSANAGFSAASMSTLSPVRDVIRRKNRPAGDRTSTRCSPSHTSGMVIGAMPRWRPSTKTIAPGCAVLTLTDATAFSSFTGSTV